MKYLQGMRWALVFALLGTAPFAAPVSGSPGTAAPKTAPRKSRARLKRKRSPAPSYQLHPDPARYREIQQALAERGYFNGEVNGVWKDDSVDALKRFQADQKLGSDGKINALTLTGLGLGPKHDGSTATAVQLPPADSQPNHPPD